MKIDKATIEIRPRSTCEIIDLALLFYRLHLGLLFPLVLILGIPVAAAGLGVVMATGQLWLGLLVFWLVLPLPSGAVILASSRIVFGVRLTVSGAITLYREIWARHFFHMLGHRLIQLVLSPFVVGYLLRLTWSFTPMVILLERLTSEPLRFRQRALYKRGGTTTFNLDVVLTCMVAAMVCALGFFFDLVFSDFIGLWETSGLFNNVAQSLLKTCLWMLAVLMVLPVANLTWFFHYLDARIRKEGWDLELGFRAMRDRMNRARGIAA